MTERKSTTSTRRKTTTKKTTARKPATKKATTVKAPTKAPAQTPEESTLEKTIAQQKSKVETYNRLKDEGLPIPADLRAGVEAAQIPEPVANPQRYVRNTNNSMFRFKLGRHVGGQRGVVLQARGTRGDLQPIEPDDLKDPILTGNLNAGYIELLTHDEAVEIVSKQTINQQAVHPAMNALRNEKGQPYGEGAVTLGRNPDEDAIVVAKLNDGQIGFDRQGIQRVRERGEAPGTPNYIGGAEPQHGPANEDPAYLSDLNARKRGHNPADGLKVVVEPTQTASIGGNPAIISDGFNPKE